LISKQSKIMIRSMFKTPSHSVFNYTPQFYDEKEEQVKKELKKKMFLDGLSEEEAEKAYHAERMRLSFRAAQERAMERTINANKRRGKGTDKTGIRVLIIFLVLCGIAWLILG